MEGYIDENRWIDLSRLPRKAYGNKTRIDWKNSIGYILPFKYDNIEGNLTICNYEVTKNGNTYLYVYIKNYIPAATRIQTGVLLNFELHKFLRHKIADYAPWMQQYLAHSMDAYKYCYSSNKYINTKCPVCGHLDKMIVSNMYYRGFRCSVCDSNISFPNRLMRSILTQLNINFIPEVGSRHGFDWMEKYLYDFYFCDKNGYGILIEMDGGFHRYEEQQKIDSKKTALALSNNFNLIRIDCQYRDDDKLEYIKNSIINSELANILPLNLIDWSKCFEDAQTNLFLQVCKMYDYGESVSNISEIIKMSKTTVHKYLQQGREIGLCTSYNPKDGRQLRKFKHIAQIENDKIIRMFKNAGELEELSDIIYGKHLCKASARAVCSGHMRSYYGLQLKYATEEEYKQYKMINNNEVVFEKEAI